MSEAKSVLVTGVTGHQGGSVVNFLLARGHNVRGLTRNTRSPTARKLAGRGVEMVTGVFTDHDSMVRAATGMDAVFAMTTPFEAGTDAETRQGQAITDAVKAAGVGHLVFSSVASADKDTGIPHFDSKYKVEKHILASGVPYTIMAPVFFMDNIFAPWALPGLQEGTLSHGMPGTRQLQQIAVMDIGAFAASLIERRDSVFGKRFDIAGDELSWDDAAGILSQTAGTTITYKGFPPEAMKDQDKDMARMYEWFDRVGYTVDIAALHREFPEVRWHTYRNWAKLQNWNILAGTAEAR